MLSMLSIIVTASIIPADTGMVAYEGNVLPEDAGFSRVTHYNPERWLEDGWFFQHVDQDEGTGGPYDGDHGDYRYDLASFAGEPFFVEWKLMTDAPNSEVDMRNAGAFMVVYGSGVRYHFNMASGLTSILRGFPYPTQYFDIEPDVPHVCRLEIYRDEYFEFTIDGEVMDSGEPEADFPTQTSELLFGSCFYQSEHTTQWDYVRFGAIPEPASFFLLLGGAMLLAQKRRRQPHI